jgi:hypothetical protein
MGQAALVGNLGDRELVGNLGDRELVGNDKGLQSKINTTKGYWYQSKAYRDGSIHMYWIIDSLICLGQRKCTPENEGGE